MGMTSWFEGDKFHLKNAQKPHQHDLENVQFLMTSVAHTKIYTSRMATKAISSIIAVMKMSMGILFLPNLNRCNRLLIFLKGRLADFANICKEKTQNVHSPLSNTFCSYITYTVISHHSTNSFPHHDMEIFWNCLDVIWTGDVQIDGDSQIYMEIPKWCFLPNLCIKWLTSGTMNWRSH
jgi:hypothetical protein